MLVKKITKDKPLDMLLQLRSDVISSTVKKEKTINTLDCSIKVFENFVNHHGLLIECHPSELFPLVDEYLHMLSNKHHLAMVINVNSGVSVYDMKYISRIEKEYASYCSIIPRMCDENLISFYICYYKSYEGEMFDIDYFCKYCS